MTSLGPLNCKPQPKPPIGEKRLRSCQWEPATTIKIPFDWPSGVYLGRLTTVPKNRNKPYWQSYVIFIVRDERPADFLFQCSDNTWHAYNKWPDNYSLYTDARGAHGGTLDEAITRANAYLDAGADMAFVEGPTDVEEVKRVCAEVDGPILYNQTGISPRFSQDELQELGIAITIAPGAALRATMQTVYDLAMEMKTDGPDAEKRFNEQFKQHPIGDFHTFAGFDQVMEWEREFLGEEELAKYANSVGHQPKAAE